MKQVINGKMYNTETATELGEYSNGLGYGDFRNVSESLYRTKKGRYFLAGEGGAMTKYSKSHAGCSSGGYGIFEMSEKEAREWVESHCNKKYTEFFEIEEA